MRAGSAAHGATVATARGETSLAAATADAKVAYLRDCATCHGRRARHGGRTVAAGRRFRGGRLLGVDRADAVGRERAAGEVAAGCSRRPGQYLADPNAQIRRRTPVVLAGRDRRAGRRTCRRSHPVARRIPTVDLGARESGRRRPGLPPAVRGVPFVVGRRRRAVSTVRAESAARRRRRRSPRRCGSVPDRCRRSAPPRSRRTSSTTSSRTSGISIIPTIAAVNRCGISDRSPKVRSRSFSGSGCAAAARVAGSDHADEPRRAGPGDRAATRS